MKKLLLILLCLPLLFTTCKKEDDTPTTSGNNNTGNTITELEQILLTGENSVLWTVTYDESEHRTGYILNGIKTYIDTTAPLEIDSSGNNKIRFYNSGAVDIIEDGDSFTLTYDIINEDRIEINGEIPFFGYLLPIWMQWDITNKTDSKIEFIYDDFYPGPAGSNDTAWFDCDQGRTIIERL